MGATAVYWNSVESALEALRTLRQHGVHADIILGTTSTKQRDSVMHALESGKLQAVMLVGCFNEGADIPFLETVCFGDVRFSKINIVQVALRAIRRHSDKPFARIVLPIQTRDLKRKAQDMTTLIRGLA